MNWRAGIGGSLRLALSFALFAMAAITARGISD
jgi:hypothetical protein